MCKFTELQFAEMSTKKNYKVAVSCTKYHLMVFIPYVVFFFFFAYTYQYAVNQRHFFFKNTHQIYTQKNKTFMKSITIQYLKIIIYFCGRKTLQTKPRFHSNAINFVTLGLKAFYKATIRSNWYFVIIFTALCFFLNASNNTCEKNVYFWCPYSFQNAGHHLRAITN